MALQDLLDKLGNKDSKNKTGYWTPSGYIVPLEVGPGRQTPFGYVVPVGFRQSQEQPQPQSPAVPSVADWAQPLPSVIEQNQLPSGRLGAVQLPSIDELQQYNPEQDAQKSALRVGSEMALGSVLDVGRGLMGAVGTGLGRVVDAGAAALEVPAALWNMNPLIQASTTTAEQFQSGAAEIARNVEAALQVKSPEQREANEQSKSQQIQPSVLNANGGQGNSNPANMNFGFNSPQNKSTIDLGALPKAPQLEYPPTPVVPDYNKTIAEMQQFAPTKPAPLPTPPKTVPGAPLDLAPMKQALEQLQVSPPKGPTERQDRTPEAEAFSWLAAITAGAAKGGNTGEALMNAASAGFQNLSNRARLYAEQDEAYQNKLLQHQMTVAQMQQTIAQAQQQNANLKIMAQNTDAKSAYQAQVAQHQLETDFASRMNQFQMQIAQMGLEADIARTNAMNNWLDKTAQYDLKQVEIDEKYRQMELPKITAKGDTIIMQHVEDGQRKIDVIRPKPGMAGFGSGGSNGKFDPYQATTGLPASVVNDLPPKVQNHQNSLMLARAAQYNGDLKSAVNAMAVELLPDAPSLFGERYVAIAKQVREEAMQSGVLDPKAQADFVEAAWIGRIAEELVKYDRLENLSKQGYTPATLLLQLTKKPTETGEQ